MAQNEPRITVTDFFFFSSVGVNALLSHSLFLVIIDQCNSRDRLVGHIYSINSNNLLFAYFYWLSLYKHEKLQHCDSSDYSGSYLKTMNVGVAALFLNLQNQINFSLYIPVP